MLFSLNRQEETPSLWLMRQAGRYLPEYRKLREKQSNFMTFCFSPDLTTEATLQPLRRFSLDAAIVFSDILVIPEVLGQSVYFEPLKGPVLEPFSPKICETSSWNFEEELEKLSPVFQAVSLVRQELPSAKSLIGFAGGPWTLSTYMIEEGKSTSSPPFQRTLSFAAENPLKFEKLLSKLSHLIALFLKEKVKAGADVLQIFDTWAGVVPEDKREIFILNPLRRIVESVRESFPDIPFVYFAKGASAYYPSLLEKIPGISFSLDAGVDLLWARESLQKKTWVQGNLDPVLLVKGGREMEEQVAKILKALSKGPFVFNLGHGVLPQTPVDHVEKLVELVKGR